MNKRKFRECIGFGEFEGKCQNLADGRNPHWCNRCDDLRIFHLNERFDEIKKEFEEEKGEMK